MYNIVEKQFDYYGKQIGKDVVVKTVRNKDEADRLLEVYYRSDSFTRYEIEEG